MDHLPSCSNNSSCQIHLIMPSKVSSRAAPTIPQNFSPIILPRKSLGLSICLWFQAQMKKVEGCISPLTGSIELCISLQHNEVLQGTLTTQVPQRMGLGGHREVAHHICIQTWCSVGMSSHIVLNRCEWKKRRLTKKTSLKTINKDLNAFD